MKALKEPTFPVFSMTEIVYVAPSVLASDFAVLAAESQRMMDAGADWLHLDVMVRFLYKE